MTPRRYANRSCWWALSLAPAALALLTLLAPRARPDDAPSEIILKFVYGSEKEDWINAATAAFQATNPQVGGKPIIIWAEPMGSGETLEAVLDQEEIVFHHHQGPDKGK